MAISLKGVGRAALGLFFSQWRGLALASLLPFGFMLLLNAFQAWQLGEMIVLSLASTEETAKDIEPLLSAAITAKLLPLFGVLVLGNFLSSWHFTRISRFWKSGMTRPFALEPDEFASTSIVFLKTIGIFFLMLGAYLVMIPAMALIAYVASLVLGQGQALFGVMMALAIIILFAMLAFAIRFFVGLPDIARGQTRGLFKDLWPMAKGKSFSLVWRISLAIAGFFVASAILQATLTLPLIGDKLPLLLTKDTHVVDPAMLRAATLGLLPWMFASLLLGVNFVMFLSVLINEICGRFTGQQNFTQSAPK